MAFLEDLGVFFNPNEFATPAIYKNVTIHGILGRKYVTINNVESYNPTFTCADAIIPVVKHGDNLTIGLMTYSVVGIHPDGTGIVVLVLEQSAWN